MIRDVAVVRRQMRAEHRPEHERSNRARRRGHRFTTLVGSVFILVAVVLNERSVAALLLPPGARVQNPTVRFAIAAVEAALLAVGVYVLVRRPAIRGRDVALATIPTLVVLLLVEGALRLALRAAPARTLAYDREVGWVPEANVRKSYDMRGFGTIRYTTGRDGFRRFGDLHGDKIRVLVIGDSFTQAYTTSDGATYYDYFAAHVPGVEIFAYGANGYGSLQEYMALDRYFDVVRPDLVLWQLCSNDVVNNDYGLETASLMNNNQRWRPYLENGRIALRYPERPEVIGHSYLLRFVASRIRMLRLSRLHEQSVEFEPGLRDPRFQRALRTTASIMALVRRRAGRVPVVAFSADRPAWLGDALERLAREQGIEVIDGVADAVARARVAGEAVDGGATGDGHWTARGNEIVGQVLSEQLTARGMLPRRASSMAAGEMPAARASAEGGGPR